MIRLHLPNCLVEDFLEIRRFQTTLGDGWLDQPTQYHEENVELSLQDLIDLLTELRDNPHARIEYEETP